MYYFRTVHILAIGYGQRAMHIGRATHWSIYRQWSGYAHHQSDNIHRSGYAHWLGYAYRSAYGPHASGYAHQAP